jgi:hypothetical protein
MMVVPAKHVLAVPNAITLGLTGTSVAFLDYLKEIRFFLQEVLPRLARLGLRREE